MDEVCRLVAQLFVVAIEGRRLCESKVYIVRWSQQVEGDHICQKLEEYEGIRRKVDIVERQVGYDLQGVNSSPEQLKRQVEDRRKQNTGEEDHFGALFDTLYDLLHLDDSLFALH